MNQEDEEIDVFSDDLETFEDEYDELWSTTDGDLPSKTASITTYAHMRIEKRPSQLSRGSSYSLTPSDPLSISKAGDIQFGCSVCEFPGFKDILTWKSKTKAKPKTKGKGKVKVKAKVQVQVKSQKKGKDVVTKKKVTLSKKKKVKKSEKKVIELPPLGPPSKQEISKRKRENTYIYQEYCAYKTNKLVDPYSGVYRKGVE